MGFWRGLETWEGRGLRGRGKGVGCLAMTCQAVGAEVENHLNEHGNVSGRFEVCLDGWVSC